MTQKNEKKKGGRVLRNVLVAALMVGLLVTTVLAAGVILGVVTDSWDSYTPWDEWGNRREGRSYEISIELELGAEAPDRIETYYMPQLPEEYRQSFGYAYSGLNFDKVDAAVYGWDVPDSEKMGIMFYQISADAYEKEGELISVFSQTGEPEMQQVTVGGKDGLLILAPDDTAWGRKYFYWSDGDYIFSMRFTNDVTQAQMDEMVASVHRVEDVRSCMVSMTEEEMEKTFDK